MTSHASSPNPARSSPAGEREDFTFSDQNFEAISKILFDSTGIYMGDGKKMLVYSRLTKRLRKLGLDSFDLYIAHILSGDGIDERKAMLTALTTNVTRFFREPHHFDHLKATVIPHLAEQAKKKGRVRIWSSACSNGQEPYSIAMAVLECFPDAAKYDFKILATDIDTNMLAQARNGIYDSQYLSLVSESNMNLYFDPVADMRDQWRVKDDVRKLVAFRELNLNGSWPMTGKFDVIFCRNVVIYFQLETQAALWSRFANVLPPLGWLYVGHSERITGPAEEIFSSKGATIYQRS